MDAIRTVYHPASGGKSARITATMGRRKCTMKWDESYSLNSQIDVELMHWIAAAALMEKINIFGIFTTGRLPDSYVHVFQT